MINSNSYLFLFITIISFCFSCKNLPKEKAPLLVKKWEKISIQFEGSTTSEVAEDNPFLNHRLSVTFTKDNKTITIPGFYAADGNAAETSAEAGNIWKVHFRPDEEGEWTYKASFRKGNNIAISDDPVAGTAIDFDGQTGRINVRPNPSSQGRLQYTGKRYLQYAESGKYFLKGGADSPENFLGYVDFDGTIRGEAPEIRKGEATANSKLHRYESHLQDWKAGDPTWKNGKGKTIIGALNYLASTGINSVYFLTMNIDGDGKDVYPYTNYNERLRFDCSKLAQWELVFDHMDHLGLMQHITLQETENELMLDGGDTKTERKLYLREIIARFAHHPRLTWNMGEENGPVHWRPEGQNTKQQKAMTEYVKTHDPYKNFTVIHSHSDKETQDKLFEPLLGYEHLEGMSMQIADKSDIHETTKKWINASAKAKKQWVMNIDEIGPYWRGVDPDDRLDNNQDTVRAEALWGNLMAGGAGAEWYFGSKNHSNDLTCENWRTRDRMWKYTNNALTFFQNYIPFYEMESHDELFAQGNGYCFAKSGQIYVVYLLFGGQGTIDLKGATGEFSVKWYNPRTGGDLQSGSVTTVRGGSVASIGNPPTDKNKDWAILIEKKR